MFLLVFKITEYFLVFVLTLKVAVFAVNLGVSFVVFDELEEDCEFVSEVVLTKSKLLIERELDSE